MANSDFLTYMESVTTKFSPLDTYNSSLCNKSLTLGPKSVHPTISSKGPSKVLKKEKQTKKQKASI